MVYAAPAEYHYKAIDPLSKWTEDEERVFSEELAEQEKACTKLVTICDRIARKLPNKTAEQVRHGRSLLTCSHLLWT